MEFPRPNQDYPFYLKENNKNPSVSVEDTNINYNLRHSLEALAAAADQAAKIAVESHQRHSSSNCFHTKSDT